MTNLLIRNESIRSSLKNLYYSSKNLFTNSRRYSASGLSLLSLITIASNMVFYLLRYLRSEPDSLKKLRIFLYISLNEKLAKLLIKYRFRASPESMFGSALLYISGGILQRLQIL